MTSIKNGPEPSSDQPPASPLSEVDSKGPIRLLYRQDNQIVIDRRLALGAGGTLVLGAIAALLAPSLGLFASPLSRQRDTEGLLAEVNPPKGYDLRTRYGGIGPQLIEAGALDWEAFITLYADSGNPLGEEEVDILTERSDKTITITRQNAHFLLNLFWAFGLANQNPILDVGPLTENSDGRIESYASTGGWTLGTRPVTELYSSANLVRLTPKQQSLVEEAAANTFRPCCNNSTAFADCNHGMAMLGLYELMAAQGATIDEMYHAAKYFNAFWFPQQALQLATYFRTTAIESFAEIDSRTIVSAQYSSASGAQLVQSWLAQKDLLPQDAGGGSCGV